MRENPQANTLAAFLVVLIAMSFLAPELAQKALLALFSVWVIARLLVALMTGLERYHG